MKHCSLGHNRNQYKHILVKSHNITKAFIFNVHLYARFVINVTPMYCCYDTKPTRHMFVKHGCPRRQQSQNMAIICKSYILTPPQPQGQMMPEKCGEPIDELTVQVWLLYHRPNFKYCTLFVSGTDLQTNRQTNGRSDY